MPTYTIGDGDQARTFEVTNLPDGRFEVLTPEGDTLTVDAFSPESGRLHMLVGARAHDVDLRAQDDPGAWVVTLGGERHEVTVWNERQVRMRKAGVGAGRAQAPELKSPMAGKVVALQVEVGQSVSQGELAVIVEAMKMENDLKVHIDGVVTEIRVAPGQAVETGDVLLVIEAADA